jgi:hypothetical protein
VTDQPEPRAIDEYSYPWAQTIDSSDGGRTIRIPWLDVDGIETGSVWVFREDASVLGAMLTAAARTAPDNPAASNNETACGYAKPHLPHQYMRLEVLGECPGVEAASDDGLREQYAAALRDAHREWLRPGSDAGQHLMADHMATVAMAVRDRRMEQLAAEVERLGDWCRVVSARALDAEADRDRWHDELASNETDRVAAVRRAETAEAAIADSAKALSHSGASWDAPIYRASDILHAALDGPADTTPPAEDPAVDTCRPVQVDGETIRVHGSRPLTGVELGYAAEIVAAARRKLDAEPPVVRADDGTESARTRRIRARQRGLILPAVEPPDDSEPPVPCPACTRARSRGFTVDALAHPGCADALAGREAAR